MKRFGRWRNSAMWLAGCAGGVLIGISVATAQEERSAREPGDRPAAGADRGGDARPGQRGEGEGRRPGPDARGPGAPGARGGRSGFGGPRPDAPPDMRRPSGRGQSGGRPRQPSDGIDAQLQRLERKLDQVLRELDELKSQPRPGGGFGGPRPPFGEMRRPAFDQPQTRRLPPRETQERRPPPRQPGARGSERGNDDGDNRRRDDDADDRGERRGPPGRGFGGPGFGGPGFGPGGFGPAPGFGPRPGGQRRDDDDDGDDDDGDEARGQRRQPSPEDFMRRLREQFGDRERERDRDRTREEDSDGREDGRRERPDREDADVF